MGDLHVPAEIRLLEDSSAAKGIAERSGLGKVRHIEVNQLWLQQKIREKDLEVHKMPGAENYADALTTVLDSGKLVWHIHQTGNRMLSGRHELMPVKAYV